MAPGGPSHMPKLAALSLPLHVLFVWIERRTMATLPCLLALAPAPASPSMAFRPEIQARSNACHALQDRDCFRELWSLCEPAFWTSWSRKSGGSQPARCQKMFVPGFPEQSPEARAAATLHNFFTFLAVKIVLAQLEDYNREAYEELMEFVNRTSLQDGDKFCAALMRESPRHKGLALRILEVRSAYARQDFEWENVKKLAIKHVEISNTTLMRQFLVETSHLE